MAGVRTPLLAASLGAALGLAIGAAVGLRLAPGAPPPPGPAASGSATPGSQQDARVRELEAEAARWRDAYEQLARSATPDQDEEEDADVATDAAAESSGSPPADAQAGAAVTFDAPSLIERGYTDEEAQRLRERYEAYQLELLYLNDRARREGWRQKPRFGSESRRLAEALQADLGDRDYDAVLYAAGRANRVRVAGVLAGSAAEGAGLRSGDEIVSYDGHRIFDAQTIVRATSQGRAGAQTEIRVRRGDQELRFLLPRGPIGIALAPARVPPEGFL